MMIVAKSMISVIMWELKTIQKIVKTRVLDTAGYIVNISRALSYLDRRLRVGKPDKDRIGDK